MDVLLRLFGSQFTEAQRELLIRLSLVEGTGQLLMQDVWVLSRCDEVLVASKSRFPSNVRPIDSASWFEESQCRRRWGR